MQTTQLYEDKFFKVFWDERTRIIRVDWRRLPLSSSDALLSLLTETSVHRKKTLQLNKGDFS